MRCGRHQQEMAGETIADHGYGRDRTEKEYAIHDTKMALTEAKREGVDERTGYRPEHVKQEAQHLPRVGRRRCDWWPRFIQGYGGTSGGPGAVGSPATRSRSSSLPSP